ncbi:divergent polysaccharide deacetylase family protein, partial [Paraburkholderia sp. SIMBA_061]
MPRVAIVIDDLGLNRPNAWDTMRLPGPLTLAFMTYADRLPDMTEAARAHGHELMVHVPMLPEDLD